MNGICDICKQQYAGFMYDVINDKGEKNKCRFALIVC